MKLHKKEIPKKWLNKKKFSFVFPINEEKKQNFDVKFALECHQVTDGKKTSDRLTSVGFMRESLVVVWI